MSSKRSCTALPSSSSISVDIVEGNDDLLIEILLFLSERSLVRFKSVSKRWRSLISAPSFCRRHTLHQPRRRRETQPLLIIGSHRSHEYYVCDPRIPRIYPYQLRFGIPEAQILQSCNGLLLLETGEKGERKRYYGVEGERKRYYVFNPITMQQRELSPLPNTHTKVELYLMFDPFLSPHYRVFCFANPKKRNVCIYLYDSETHEWRLCDEPLKMGRHNRKGFYFNGCICFPGFRSSLLFAHDYKLIKIQDPPQPPNCSLGTRSKYYVSNGVMLCLRFYWNKGSNQLHVWEMKENESQWSKKYEVDMNPVLALWGEGDGSVRLLSVIWGEKEQYAVLLSKFSGELKVYKFHDDTFVDIDEYFQQFRKEIRESCFRHAHHFFTQSLASV